MNRLALSTFLLAGLASAGAALAQDYQRGRAVDRAEQRIGGQRHDAPRYDSRDDARNHSRAEQRRDNGAYWNNQRDNHWERDAERSRDSRFHADPGKAYRHDDRNWQVDRGLPHSDPRHNRYRDDRYRNDYRSDWRNDWRDSRWRSHWRHGWEGNRYRAAVRYHYPQGYSRYHWRVGFTLPGVFLSRSWYVDYQPYGIAPPPYGCRWVRVDGDLLLVELASGYIVDVLYDFYY